MRRRETEKKAADYGNVDVAAAFGKAVVLTADRILSECAIQCIHQPGVSSLLIEILNKRSAVGIYLKKNH
mgnify:CR=1 FL=1